MLALTFLFTLAIAQVYCQFNLTKLVPTGAIFTPGMGTSVSLSSDGVYLAAGGHGDNGGQGAVWIFIRGASWVQQAKLVPTGAIGSSYMGYSSSLSSNGVYLAAGGIYDNGSQGAVWIFIRSGVSWTQQAKVVPTGTIGIQTFMGISSSLSSDGVYLAAGGYYDNSGQGAVWIFIRSGASWSQQAKLVPTGVIGTPAVGFSVSLSSDGVYLASGGYGDNGSQGAVWIFFRSGASWTQQVKLVPTGAIGNPLMGQSVSLSSDGTYLATGGYYDNSQQGAVWIFFRTGVSWIQQAKLVPIGAIGSPYLGQSASLSSDGFYLAAGGYRDNGFQGAVWIFIRSGASWTQHAKVVPTGAIGSGPGMGVSSSLSSDGFYLAAGGNGDNGSQGAVWFTNLCSDNALESPTTTGVCICSSGFSSQGSFGRPGLVCTICSAGRYCPLNSTFPLTQAPLCQLGNYCPPGSASQILCSAGYYCPNTTVQLRCPVGFYCPSSSTAPIPCPAGVYGIQLGLSSAQCTGACPIGSYGSSTGLTTSYCSGPCSAGYYCLSGSIAANGTRASSLAVNLCPAGYYCLSGTVNPIPCTLRGDYCPAGSGVVDPPCPATKYCRDSTSTPLDCSNPSQCPQGCYEDLCSKNVINPGSSDGSSNNAIIGGVISGVLSLVSAVIVFFLKKHFAKKAKEEEDRCLNQTGESQQEWIRAVKPLIQSVFEHVKTTGFCSSRSGKELKRMVSSIQSIIGVIESKGIPLHSKMLKPGESSVINHCIIDSFVQQLQISRFMRYFLADADAVKFEKCADLISETAVNAIRRKIPSIGAIGKNLNHLSVEIEFGKDLSYDHNRQHTLSTSINPALI